MNAEMRYYVARTDGTIQRFTTLAQANGHADHLYRSAGVVAPLVVTAPDRASALDKAARCYRREITCAQARNPKVK